MKIPILINHEDIKAGTRLVAIEDLALNKIIKEEKDAKSNVVEKGKSAKKKKTE